MRKFKWFLLRILALTLPLWWSFYSVGASQAGLEPQKVYASTQPGAPCLNGDEITMEVWNVEAAGGEQYEEVFINGKSGEFSFSGGENGFLLQNAYKGRFNSLDEYLQNQSDSAGNPQTFWMWWQFVDGVQVEQHVC